MARSQPDITSLFYKGHHRKVAQLTLDNVEGSFPISETVPAIGALVFLGRLDEADTLFSLREAGLDEKQKIASRFYLGIGACRHSHYDKSRKFFTQNLRLRNAKLDPTSKFYLYQGIAFYRYFSGEMRSALKWAELSFENAIAGSFLFGKALASDLTGHTLIQNGQIRKGLRTLELAASLAQHLGAQWLEEAIQVSILSHRSRYGIDSHNIEVELETQINLLSQEDIYSQSSLLLELAIQRIRRGKLTKAKEALNACCRIVYGTENRRHAALLNLRYGHIQYLEGETHQALNLVRNALTQISPDVDRLLELKLRGLEKLCLEALSLDTKVVKTTIQRLTNEVGEFTGRRILNRDSQGNSFAAVGEDPLGDILDDLPTHRERAQLQLIQFEYFGYLPQALGLPLGERILYLDLEPESLTVFDKGNVVHFPSSLSRSLRLILEELGRGQKSKKELIENIWRYEYHPIRHDALIYSAVAKLRKVLNSRSHWIEVSENGYSLRSDVAVRFHPRLPVPERSQSPISVVLSSTEGPRLNHRQQGIMRYLQENEFIDATTCRNLFATSTITATRDLSELLKLKILKKTGQARATKYSLTIT